MGSEMCIRDRPVVVADEPLTCVARGGGRVLELLDQYGPGAFDVE